MNATETAAVAVAAAAQRTRRLSTEQAVTVVCVVSDLVLAHGVCITCPAPLLYRRLPQDRRWQLEGAAMAARGGGDGS